jgi:hypothetical protein
MLTSTAIVHSRGGVPCAPGGVFWARAGREAGPDCKRCCAERNFAIESGHSIQYGHIPEVAEGRGAE